LQLWGALRFLPFFALLDNFLLALFIFVILFQFCKFYQIPQIFARPPVTPSAIPAARWPQVGQ
jgi:hypothetical protein